MGPVSAQQNFSDLRDSHRLLKEARREVEAIAQARTQGLADDNPIEQMWSQVKAFLPKAKARTLPALLQTIAAALQTAAGQQSRRRGVGVLVGS